MVSVSPRVSFPDSDSENEPASTDPRFSLGFRSMSLDSAGYSDHEPADDHRPFAGIADSSVSRRRRRHDRNNELLNAAPCHTYSTDADGDAFRLVILQPGAGREPIECSLIWASTQGEQKHYRCLSYAWGSIERDCAILIDGCKFPVTSNLLSALQSFRKPRQTVLIWVDQICINQDNTRERAHQVSIMKKIFSQATRVYVWLGEDEDRSERLCAYARSMRRGSEEGSKTVLNRILSPRELREAIQKLLQRPWFQRVWVIQEIALARDITVACGQAHITWRELVRLIRYVERPVNPGFDKHVSLLGNPRQRLAILTQMIAGQREDRAHTDITQLLIVGKGSQATDSRDMVYAFYGLTQLTTVPDYSAPLEPASPRYKEALQRLYIDVAHQYINAINWEASYASCHALTDEHKTFQLMSIIYSAGALHHHLQMPSWVPDWTFAWHISSVFCRTIPNFTTSTVGKDEWSLGVRTKYRAGGERLETFEVNPHRLHLRVSALIIGTIIMVNEDTPVPTPSSSQILSKPSLPPDPDQTDISTLKYGRCSFLTTDDHMGYATPGIARGDRVALLVGGDVPVILREVSLADDAVGAERQRYQLLCECYLESSMIMYGEYMRANWTNSEEIRIV